MSKKSNHKHDYEFIKINESWFTHKKVCKICGHEYEKLRKEV